MANYTAYPTRKTTPNRLTRKGMRNKVFQANKTAKKKEKEARKAVV